jgi:hypothetical protein
MIANPKLLIIARSSEALPAKVRSPLLRQFLLSSSMAYFVRVKRNSVGEIHPVKSSLFPEISNGTRKVGNSLFSITEKSNNVLPVVRCFR